MGQDWGQVSFTDELSVEMGESVRRKVTISRPGEEYDPEHVQKTFHSHRETLMVLGAVAHGKKWPLVRLPLAPSTVSGGQGIRAEGLSWQRYAEWIISDQLSAMTQEMMSEGREDVLVLEDGAPHTRARSPRRLNSIAESLTFRIPPLHPT